MVALAVVEVVLDLRHGGVGGREHSGAVVDDPLDEESEAFLLPDAPSVVLVRVVAEEDDVGDASPVPILFPVEVNEAVDHVHEPPKVALGGVGWVGVPAPLVDLYEEAAVLPQPEQVGASLLRHVAGLSEERVVGRREGGVKDINTFCRLSIQRACADQR